MCAVLCGLDTLGDLVIYAKNTKDFLAKEFGIEAIPFCLPQEIFYYGPCAFHSFGFRSSAFHSPLFMRQACCTSSVHVPQREICGILRAYPQIKYSLKAVEKIEKKSCKLWTISDGFWEAVKDEIPQRQRAEGKTYKRKPDGGRKPLTKRRVLEGIFYVLRTGCQRCSRVAIRPVFVPAGRKRRNWNAP